MLETDNYEKFKKDVLSIAKIDLNSYKEKQMRRRINTLITKNNIKTYDEYVTLIKKDKEKIRAVYQFPHDQCFRVLSESGTVENLRGRGVPTVDPEIRQESEDLECSMFDRR